MSACYARNMKGRMSRLVVTALIVLLSGTPAFAALCAELCGLEPAPAATATHCSKHRGMPVAGTAEASGHDHHGIPSASDRRSAAPRVDALAVVVGHGPGCCGRMTIPPAVATKVSRTDAPSSFVVLASGPYVAYPTVGPVLPAPPPGSSGPPAPSRAPLVLRI